MWIGTLPMNVRRNPLLTDKSKLLYAEITALLDENAECRISNKKLSMWFGVSQSSVKNYLKELKDNELINVVGEGRSRVITLSEFSVVREVKENKKEKKENKKELTEKIVAYWNEEVVKGRGIRVTPKLIEKVTSRCKVFPDDELFEAVKKRAEFVNNSEWHNKPENIHHKKNIDILLRSDDDVNKVLLIENKGKKPDDSDINVFKIN